MSNQRTLSLSFRDFGPADYQRLEEIYNANYPEYATSATEQRARDDSIDKSKYVLRRFVCLDKRTDAILGFGGVFNVLDMFHPRKFMVNIYVDPQHQRMGVGSAIFDKLLIELRNRDAEIAWTMNKEDLPEHRVFFQKRGFQEKRKDWESRLDLSTFEPGKFQGYSVKMANKGISFTTLAREIDGSEESLRRLHELVQHISEDMPRQTDFTPVPYEQWKALELNSPRLLPEGYLIAKRDSQLVGLSVVYRNEKDPQLLTQGDTGVRREYRGRGIAIALKLRVIEFARKKGYAGIETWNDSTNAPMLAVNTKLGFKRHVGWILMERNLRPQSIAN
jgi:GNAT superfamily N-acetyltransferase